MYKFVLVILSVLFTSCAMLIPAKQYEGKTKPKSEVAVVKGYFGQLFGDDYHTNISGFTEIRQDKVGLNKKLGDTAFVGHPKTIHLLPGRYIVELYCFKSPLYAYPKIQVDVEKGMTYVLRCKNVDGKAQAFLDSETATK